MKITEKSIMSDILEENAKAAKILMEAGMHCVGCPMAMQETLEDGCMAHEMNEKQIEKLVEVLNKK